MAFSPATVDEVQRRLEQQRGLAHLCHAMQRISQRHVELVGKHGDGGFLLRCAAHPIPSYESPALYILHREGRSVNGVRPRDTALVTRRPSPFVLAPRPSRALAPTRSRTPLESVL